MGIFDCFSKKTTDGEIRTLYLNSARPSWLSAEPHENQKPEPKYPPNTVKTSKYTVLNFLPKNLFEQFRRAANFYFLCVAIIQMVIDTPVAAWTSVVPLVLVVSVTALKQGYEDYRRHRADNKVNNAPAKRLTKDGVKDIKSSSIRVGDIIRVDQNQEFTCDILLLFSADDAKSCDVNTVNLDGETNLKKFQCPPDLELVNESSLANMEGLLTCQLPHPNLYDFKGKLEAKSPSGPVQTMALNTENLLLRGSKLVNTEYIYGCVVYTGPDTKLALNLKLTSNKFSTVEVSMNYYLIVYFAVLALEILICTLLKYFVYDNERISTWWYLGPTDLGVTTSDVAQDALSFLVIFNYIIPISLYVTLEGQKFLGVFFFIWDEEMRLEPDGEYATCNTSDLNEELGQVQYLFSDKTGTLTQNKMRFRQFTCGGIKYKVQNGQIYETNDELQEMHPVNDKYPEEITQLLTTLALCHTVQATHRSKVKLPVGSVKDDRAKLREIFKLRKKQKKNNNNQHKSLESVADGISQDVFEEEDAFFGEFVYQAASPDEKALVEACQRLKVIYTGEISSIAHVSVLGEEQDWKILQILDFDSDRRRMSVIVQTPDNCIRLLCKGADSSVLPYCHQSRISDVTSLHLDNFANAGLRTLTVGWRDFSEKEYQEIEKRLRVAQQAVEGRDQLLRTIYDDLERDMKLIGATGVEDQLQEEVALTLESLRLAGVKVWVLTGDKLETAVNISLSCGHFKRSMIQLELTLAKNEQDALKKLVKAKALLDENNCEEHKFRLTLDGQTAAYLLNNKKTELSDICGFCEAVLCCRMAPKQKAEVVKMVKSQSSSPICAAIGDGANDVSMIQEAHVGIGIMGSEGRQAVRCSDFGFSQFRFLLRALLVHGRWYYVRVSFLVNYSFYKNVAFITPQVYYAFFNGMSTQSLYESLALTFYNITFTSLPVLIYGLFEQDIPDFLLLKYPHFYSHYTKNANMTWKHFITWALLGLWHSWALFFGLYYTTLDDSSISYPGVQTPDLYLFGTTLVSSVVTVVNFKLLLETFHHNMFVSISMGITFIGYLLFMFLYCSFMTDFFANYGIFWTIYLMFTSPSILLYMLLLCVTCLIPDICIKVIRLQFSPDTSIRKGPEYHQWWKPIVNLFQKRRSSAKLSISQLQLVSQ